MNVKKVKEKRDQSRCGRCYFLISFIVVSSFFLQDYISFIFLLVFFFVVFSFGVVVVLIFGEDNKGES